MSDYLFVRPSAHLYGHHPSPFQSTLALPSPVSPEGPPQEGKAFPAPVAIETIECPFADNPVRAVVFSDGSKWVVAKDICEGLGLTGKDPLARLHLSQKQTITKGATPVEQGNLLFRGTLSRLALISRGGMNDLILESRKPAARGFRQWLTDTVIPRLQDTGAYTDPNHPDTVAHLGAALSGFP